MQNIQIISFTPESFAAYLQDTVQKAVTDALTTSKDLMIREEPVPRKEAKAAAGYKDELSFRMFLKSNHIEPVETRNRVDYFMLSEIRSAQRKKGVHIK